MTSYQKVHYQVDQGVARITLNRTEKRNALDPELISELRNAIASSARDETIRVVLLKGNGSDFCSGMDLGALSKASKRMCSKAEPMHKLLPSCFSRCGDIPGRSWPRFMAVRSRADAVWLLRPTSSWRHTRRSSVTRK